MLRFKKPNGDSFSSLQEIHMRDITTEYNVRNKNRLPLDIYSVNNIVGFLPQSEQFDEAGYLHNTDTSIYMIVPNGCFAYNPARIDIGSIGYQNTGRDVQVSSLYVVFKTSDEVDDNYLWQWFHTNHFRNSVRRLQEGGVRLYYYYDKLEETRISLPCLEEQQKIADCLSSVDAVIDDYEAQVENMQNQKKGVMQKLFSQEVRFKADDGSEYPEWEKATISECCDILDSKRKPITKQFREKGPYPYYGATNIQDHVSGYLFDEPLVLMAEDGGPFNDFFNKPIAQWAEGKFWVNNHAHVLRPHGNRKFMFYVLVHKDIRNYINNPGRGKLNQEDMRRIIVPQPCLEEQQKIADCLTSFDDVIEDLQKTVEHWKNIKKGLLQQLFA